MQYILGVRESDGKKGMGIEGKSILIEQGLRHALSQRRQHGQFRLRKATFKGRGLSATARGTGWEQLRELGPPQGSRQAQPGSDSGNGRIDFLIARFESLQSERGVPVCAEKAFQFVHDGKFHLFHQSQPRMLVGGCVEQ
jgi:hypothetical protein